MSELSDTLTLLTSFQVGLFKDDYERERRDRESYYDKNEVEKIELRSTINYQEQQIKALRTRAGVGEYQQGAQSQNRDETLKRELAAVTQSKIKCEQELEWYKEKLRRLQQISAEVRHLSLSCSVHVVTACPIGSVFTKLCLVCT